MYSHWLQTDSMPYWGIGICFSGSNPFIWKTVEYTPVFISKGGSSFSKGVEMAVMVRVPDGTSPGGDSSVMGSVLMVAEGKSADRYHFSLSVSSVGGGQAHV